MTLVASPAPRRPRPRQWPRRVLLALLLLALVVSVSVAYFVSFASSEMTALAAEIDRLDPGWRLEDIEAGRKAVPDAQNSALQIMAIKTLQGGQSVWTPAMDKLFGVYPEPELAPQTHLNEQQAAYLAQRFEILRKPLLEARKLAGMPDGRYPIQYSANFFSTRVNGQDARGVMELLRWDAARRVHDGDADGALDSCLALVHTARSLGDEPTLISQLMRYAGTGVAVGAIERTLAQGHFADASEPSLQRLQAALAKELQEQTLLLALRGERAGAHHLLQALAAGKVSAKTFGSLLGGGDVEPSLIEFVPGYLTREHTALLGHLNNLVEAAKLPSAERDKRFQVLEQQTRGQTLGLVRALAPALTKISEAERRTQANLLCTSTALAAERYRVARNQWPESLEALVKANFLLAAPPDPYDGKPLRLKRTAEGLNVYSVGQDKVDNGGCIDRDRPGDAGTDLGFRLWDVAHRRQPPNPPMPE